MSTSPGPLVFGPPSRDMTYYPRALPGNDLALYILVFGIVVWREGWWREEVLVCFLFCSSTVLLVSLRHLGLRLSILSFFRLSGRLAWISVTPTPHVTLSLQNYLRFLQSMLLASLCIPPSFCTPYSVTRTD